MHRDAITTVRGQTIEIDAAQHELQESEMYRFTHEHSNNNNNNNNIDSFQLDLISISRWHRYQPLKQYCRTATRYHYLAYRVTDLLPPAVVKAPTLNSFKAQLEKVWSRHILYSAKSPAPMRSVNPLTNNIHEWYSNIMPEEKLYIGMVTELIEVRDGWRVIAGFSYRVALRRCHSRTKQVNITLFWCEECGVWSRH